MSPPVIFSHGPPEGFNAPERFHLFVCVLIELIVHFKSNVLLLSERGLSSSTSTYHKVPVLEVELKWLRV